MNGARITVLDAGVVVAYFVGTVAFGIWSGRRKIRNAEQFFLADRAESWPLVGASLFAANISSQQFVGQGQAILCREPRDLGAKTCRVWRMTRLEL